MEFWSSPEAGILVAGIPLALAILLLAERLGRRKPPQKPPEAPVAPPPALRPARTRLADALSKTRDALARRIDEVLGRLPERDQLFASLEEILIGADVGIKTAGKILERVRKNLAAGGDPAEVRGALRAAVEEILGDGTRPEVREKPWVILVAGVNGVGKTTSIGKLAARYRQEGKRVLLVAADTFRAAAIDQLAIWADRAEADLVRHQAGSDPAAVAFDGLRAAKARGSDVVILDTAGRLHTRQNLIEELRKVVRVLGRELEGAPHEVLLVLDATTGQNALRQVEVFTEAVGVTGVILTKLDGTAKGGAALAVREQLGVPIQYVGVGESVEDLRPFSACEFAAALIGLPD